MNGKTCLDCRLELPLERFSRNVRKKDGLDTYCKACAGKRGAVWARANSERRKAQNAGWRARNPGKAAAYCKKWREANPDAQRQSMRRWYEANREAVLEKDRLARLADLENYLRRERESYARNVAARSERMRRWREENPDKICAYAAERRAAKARRTPPWLTEEHRAQIEKVFATAKWLTDVTGVLFHVDHVIPLRGKAVSGLHVPWNLQCLPYMVNLSKNNKVVDA